MSNSPKFTKVYPLPSYAGAQPVYRCSLPWVGSQDCYVRQNAGVWETAEIVTDLARCKFTACPVVPNRRYDAVMAFDYYFGGKS